MRLLYVASLCALVACDEEPEFFRFDFDRGVACPGDPLTLTWRAQAINVQVAAANLDPLLARSPNDQEFFFMGSGVLSAQGTANGFGASDHANDSVAPFAPKTLTVDGVRVCNSNAVTETLNFQGIDGAPDSVVVTSVRAPQGRTGIILGPALSSEYTPGQTFQVDGRLALGAWTFTYDLLAGERCDAGTTGSGTPPPDLSLVVDVRCAPDGPPAPLVDTATCGRHGQRCCGTFARCEAGLQCNTNTCITGPTTCSGAAAGPNATTHPYARVAAGTRCVIDFAAPVANTAEEAEGCLTTIDIAAVPAAEVDEHAWQRPGEDCRLNGGTFQATEDDAETCAKALCACSDPVLDAPCP